MLQGELTQVRHAGITGFGAGSSRGRVRSPRFSGVIGGMKGTGGSGGGDTPRALSRRDMRAPGWGIAAKSPVAGPPLLTSWAGSALAS
ncbi:hypothetical protein Aph01nite_60690 [Acrocarpospora phusangensis]|uniref:Uncharacterized protein n=2 Tax=Acrocarpospora phusangensis TaxID=1070424 RepID=A0A919QGZ3_9ACTN|nr:hypothetical protein Aph01nite_60690 [Acrocarpospora phusangensis]